jgi:surface antigen
MFTAKKLDSCPRWQAMLVSGQRTRQMMRRNAQAVCLVAAVLGTASTAALADQSWARRDTAARGDTCKHALECEGRFMLAAGPPPWAPAHGYRRKHKHKHEHHYDSHHHHHEYGQHVAVPDVGIELGRCNRELIGGILGGVTGGVIGSRVGEGSNKTAVTIGGTIFGVLIGGAIGRSMDEADHACVAHTLEQAPPGHPVTWSDPDGRQYRVVPLEAYEDHRGRTCRNYRTTASFGSRDQQLYGTACRDADGNWQQVS